jgi:exonuclease SbcD
VTSIGRVKLLHTADWHVGRTLRGRGRASEHRTVLAEVARIAASEQVDVVLVAGDLFDASAPAPEAEQIVYTALMQLAHTGADVVVVAGNHDSAQRLAAVRPLLDLARVRTISFPERPDEGGVIRVDARSGGCIRIAALPFLSQRSIVRAEQLMAEDADQHAMLYADRCRNVVDALCRDFAGDCVNVVVAHLTVTGGELGGGEREAHTLFDYHVPPQVFPATAHYVALGHLHRAQRIAGACPIWYSGAPLQLDFGESANDPCVLIIEAEPGVPAHVRSVPITGARRLRTIRGTLVQLETLGAEVGNDHLRVMVTEPTRVGLADDVRALFPNAVDVVIVREAVAEASDEWTLEHVRRSPVELFAEYLQEKKVKDPGMTALFRQLLEQRDEEPAT